MVNAAFQSARLDGIVFHDRTVAPRNAFRYGISCFRFDLDELPRLDEALRFFAYGRRGVFSLRDRDYLVGGGRSLAEDFRFYATERGIPGPFRRVELVTLARLCGYVFNPVSFAFLYDENEALAAIVAEINNTFGETHRHLFDARVATRSDDGWSFEAPKEFHISPFFPPDLRHRFSFAGVDHPGGAHVRAQVENFKDGERIFLAVLDAKARPLSDRTLLGAALRRPLMTAKVIAAIHWQALKLWVRGAVVYAHPTKRGGPGYERKR